MGRYRSPPPKKGHLRPANLAKTVRAHNSKVKWYLQKRLVYVARHALLFPVVGRSPQLVLLPCRDGWDPACGCPAYSEDLDTDEWLNGPQSVSSLDHFPGTRSRLANGYDILVLSRKGQRTRKRPSNETIRRMFSIEWAGALLVVKRAQYDRGRVVHITRPEISLINTIVESWLQMMTGDTE